MTRTDDTRDGTAESSPRSKWLSPRLIITVVVLVLALVFIFSNQRTATLHFLAFQFIAPGWLWFLVVLAAGVVIGSIFPWFRKKK